MPSENEDVRFFEGIRLFNERDFFEAHEVWEDLWHDTTGPDRRFIQGLIQAAVCVYHAINGNRTGSKRLFESGKRYMRLSGSKHRGLDIDLFWAQMEAGLVDFFDDENSGIMYVDSDRLPIIVIES